VGANGMSVLYIKQVLSSTTYAKKRDLTPRGVKGIVSEKILIKTDG
jgi:hypothetical protein